MSGQTTHYQHHHRAQSPPIINRTRHLQDDESFFLSSLHILMRFRYHRILGACCCNKYVVVVAIHDSGTNVIRNRLCSKCHRRSINASLSSLRLRFSLSRRNGFGDFSSIWLRRFSPHFVRGSGEKVIGAESVGMSEGCGKKMCDAERRRRSEKKTRHIRVITICNWGTEIKIEIERTNFLLFFSCWDGCLARDVTSVHQSLSFLLLGKASNKFAASQNLISVSNRKRFARWVLCW